MNNPIIEKAVSLIEAQQAKVKARSPQWMVGEQLKDICRREPGNAELIAQDLENESMSITKAEKKIKAFADKNKTGSFSCVTPVESDRILREFYGLPAADVAASGAIQEPAPDRPPQVGPRLPTRADGIIPLEDFL